MPNTDARHRGTVVLPRDAADLETGSYRTRVPESIASGKAKGAQEQSLWRFKCPAQQPDQHRVIVQRTCNWNKTLCVAAPASISANNIVQKSLRLSSPEWDPSLHSISSVGPTWDFSQIPSI